MSWPLWCLWHKVRETLIEPFPTEDRYLEMWSSGPHICQGCFRLPPRVHSGTFSSRSAIQPDWRPSGAVAGSVLLVASEPSISHQAAASLPYASRCVTHFLAHGPYLSLSSCSHFGLFCHLPVLVGVWACHSWWLVEATVFGSWWGTLE